VNPAAASIFEAIGRGDLVTANPRRPGRGRRYTDAPAEPRNTRPEKCRICGARL